MARLDPASYKPIQQYHFQVQFSTLDVDGGFVTYAKATALPSVENSPIRVDYGNTYMHVKGKTVWSEISMTFYALSTPDTTAKFWSYINKHQSISDGKDSFKDTYMGDIQIKLLTPEYITVGTWKLINAFVSSMNFGSVDWSSEEVIQPEITFVYDYATWE